MPFIAPAIASVSSAFAAGGILAAGTVGGFLAKLGGSILLSAASKALQKKPNAPIENLGRTVTARQPVAPRDIVYGRTRKGGVITYMNLRGDRNEELDLIIVLAGHRVKSIGAIYFDGELAIAAGSVFGTGRWGAGGVPNNPNPSAGVERALGDENQSAFPILRTISPELWTAEHRLRGIAAIRLSLSFSQDAFPNGIPNITVDIEGKDDILDPRTGLRGYTENAALCLADYMSLTRYSIGAQIGAADGINEAELIASANVCDEIVARVGGGTEPRYACNGILSLAEWPQNNIVDMLTAMAGTAGDAGGQWSIFAGYYRAPAVTLTSSDVRANGLSLATRQSMAENFNGVRGTFVSPENDWQPDDFPSYRSAVYVAEDNGEERWRDIVLPFTISASAAQRLAKIQLEEQRRQQTVEFSGMLAAWKVGVGDTVNLTYDRWGLAAKPFTVRDLSLSLEQQGDGPALLPTLTLRETSPLIYDWNTSEAQIYAAAPRTNLPNAFEVAAPGSPSVVESLYPTTNSSGVKVRVDLAWPEAPSPFVEQYQVETRLGASGDWTVQGRTDQTSLALLDWTAGDWQFRVKAVSSLGVSSDYAVTIARIFGLSAAPAALTGITAQIANGLTLLTWNQTTDLDVQINGEIEIRHSTNAAPALVNSYRLSAAPGGATQILVPQLPGTYFLRPIDSEGTPGPASQIAVSGNTALEFAPVQTLQADPTFAGTKVSTEVLSSALKLTSSVTVASWPLVSAIPQVGATGGYVAEGRYDFATGMNLGSLRRVRLRSQINLVAENPLDQIGTRLGNVSSWERVTGSGGGEVDCVVEFRTSQTNPGGSPVWSEWGRVDNTEIRAWGVQARAFLRTRDASFTPAVSELRVIAEEVV